MPFEIYCRRFRPLPSRLPNRGDIVPSGVPSFCLSSLIALAFFRSGDLTVAISYLLGSFSVYPPFCHRRFRLRPFVQAVESWLYCDSSCVCALFDTHQGIGDMVILRFRASLYSGLYSELYSWVLFQPPTTGSTGPRLHRAAEL